MRSTPTYTSHGCKLSLKPKLTSPYIPSPHHGTETILSWVYNLRGLVVQTAWGSKWIIGWRNQKQARAVNKMSNWIKQTGMQRLLPSSLRSPSFMLLLIVTPAWRRRLLMHASKTHKDARTQEEVVIDHNDQQHLLGKQACGCAEKLLISRNNVNISVPKSKSLEVWSLICERLKVR